MRQFLIGNMSLGTTNSQMRFLRKTKNKQRNEKQLDAEKLKRKNTEEFHRKKFKKLLHIGRKAVLELKNLNKEDINPAYAVAIKSVIDDFDHPFIKFTVRNAVHADIVLSRAKKYNQQKEEAVEKMLQLLKV